MEWNVMQCTVCMYGCMYVCTYVCVYVCVYIYTYTSVLLCIDMHNLVWITLQGSSGCVCRSQLDFSMDYFVQIVPSYISSVRHLIRAASTFCGASVSVHEVLSFVSHRFCEALVSF